MKEYSADRELLEAAAKAIGLYEDGYRAQFRKHEGWWMVRPADEKCPCQCIWSALVDDGDALRLAVDLRLDIGHGKGHVMVDSDRIPGPVVTELHGDDIAAATRRAIVRAAAALAPKGANQAAATP